ncbi:hypothetical protein D3Z48_21735, partial [Clostridiaceae bacterium]|nr:hypothetical protein [Clostridiaceae bacterium]
MIIAASPNDYERNDTICECFTQSFPMSGLSISCMEICDNRNEKLADKIKEMDVVLLAGGHVPTQNNFFHRIGLKNRLEDFNGLLISWSAGSMNCIMVPGIQTTPYEKDREHGRMYQSR